MKNTVELLKVVNSLRTEVENLQTQEMWDAAAKKAKELTDAVNEYQVAKSLEDADITNVVSKANPIHSSFDKPDTRIKNRIFNKLLLGRPLTDAEMDMQNKAGTPGLVEATSEKGGYIVPEEQMHVLYELRRAVPNLKSLVSVTGVSAPSGTAPSLGAETGKLTAFDELTDIKKSDFDFGRISYKTTDYGDIIPVSNTLLADNDFNLMQIIGRRFIRKSINTENDAIGKLLVSKSGTAITDWKGLTTALNKTLDPAISAAAKIVTNQSGLEWLDELVDSQNRPLLTPDLVNPNIMRFRGREVVVMTDALLSETKKIPFYVGSFKDAIVFFDRQQVEVAVSTEAGFVQNATLIRAIERFDTKILDSDAFVHLNFAVGG